MLLWSEVKSVLGGRRISGNGGSGFRIVMSCHAQKRAMAKTSTIDRAASVSVPSSTTCAGNREGHPRFSRRRQRNFRMARDPSGHSCCPA